MSCLRNRLEKAGPGAGKGSRLGVGKNSKPRVWRLGLPHQIGSIIMVEAN